jgi:hypothetical protein
MPKKGSTLIKAPKGILKMNKLEPGNLVFSDQYGSPLLGRQFSACGNDLTVQKICGVTIFCNAASSKLTVIHQVGLTGTETVQAKLHFKCEVTAAKFEVHAYCTNNGVYLQRIFLQILLKICLQRPRNQAQWRGRASSQWSCQKHNQAR